MTIVPNSLQRLKRSLALSYTAEESNTELIDRP